MGHAAVVLPQIEIFGGGHPGVEYLLECGAKRDRRFSGSVRSSGSVSLWPIFLSWVSACETGDELTDFVKPFLPHFLSQILSQSFCAHDFYLS